VFFQALTFKFFLQQAALLGQSLRTQQMFKSFSLAQGVAEVQDAKARQALQERAVQVEAEGHIPPLSSVRRL